MADNDDGKAPDDRLIIPHVPEQAPGLTFEVKPSGLIGLANSGPATKDDHQQIDDIRDVLLDALEDATKLCAGSNAFDQIGRIVAKYKTILEADPLSIDKLYAWGVRLENANTSISVSIKSGDLPAKDLNITEALDSVLALHGTSILLTQRGQMLVAKSKEYHRTAAEQLAYREKSKSLIEKIRGKNNFVETFRGSGVELNLHASRTP